MKAKKYSKKSLPDKDSFNKVDIERKKKANKPQRKKQTDF